MYYSWNLFKELLGFIFQNMVWNVSVWGPMMSHMTYESWPPGRVLSFGNSILKYQFLVFHSFCIGVMTFYLFNMSCDDQYVQLLVKQNSELGYMTKNANYTLIAIFLCVILLILSLMKGKQENAVDFFFCCCLHWYLLLRHFCITFQNIYMQLSNN